MTELEKMRSGLQYDYATPEVEASWKHARSLCARLQTMTVHDDDYREVIEDLIPGFPKTSELMPPFHCDHGSSIIVGEHVCINYNCTMLDEGLITIGNHVLIGPNCSFYTPQHPKDYLQRRNPTETGHSITIGDDTWICGNVTICPGVTIGARCIIAAGSVVTKNIPDDSMAAGNPAVVKRHLIPPSSR